MKRLLAAMLALVMLLGLTACGGKKKGSTLVGYYTLTYAEMPGMTMDSDMLKSMGMADSMYLQLDEGGTGTMCMEVGKSYAITYDEKAATITVPDAGIAFPFTVEGDNITIDMEAESTKMVYTRSDGTAPATSGAAAGGTAPALGDAAGIDTFDFESVTVASTLDDALAGIPGSSAPAYTDGGDTDTGSSSGFVSPTTTLYTDMTWFGTMICSNAQGASTQNYTKDIIGFLSTTDDGRTYFEISTDSSMDSEFIKFSAYVTIDYGDDGFTADIGEDDAWVLDRYLTPEEWWDFSPTLKNGALEMNYAYVDPDDGSTCDVRFFLRENGTEWDEENDPLPPSYDRYREAISK